MSITTRRSFLEVLGLATGGFLLRKTPLGDAFAQQADPQYFLMVYFEGGWDQLLALDPRNQTEARFKRVGGAAPTSRIEPAYIEAANANPFVDAVMTNTGGSGVQARGNLTFGPAVPASLLNHAADFCIIRGVNMDTVTHDVGRRYLLTGKFPRGLSANGSSLNTVASTELGMKGDIPNLSIGVETYNQGSPPAASAIGVGSYADLLTVMQPQQGATLSAPSLSAVRQFQDADDTCLQHGYDGTGLVQAFKSSMAFSRGLVQPAKAALFDFKFPVPTALTGLYSAFGLTAAADLNTVRARAAVAAQAMATGISPVVSVSLANGLDDHFDMFGSHPATLRDGFDALARLVSYLKTKPAPNSTKSVWQCTTMMVFSEFGRTPLINTRDGRDHHVTSSLLVAGPGIKADTVFGASSEVGMLNQKWNFNTGALDQTGGALIRPTDVHATLLDSMGVSYSNLSNQTPRIIQAIKR